MRRFYVPLILGSLFLINANANEQNSIQNKAAQKNYAVLEVEDDSYDVSDGDSVGYERPRIHSHHSYEQYAYSGSGGGHRKHKKHGGGGGFPSERPATGNSVFIFNPNSLSWAAYNSSGHLVRTGHGVGGRHYCPDIHRGCKTPIGVFSVHAKMGPGFRSSRYPVGEGGAPMPWAMFFTKYYAIHGSNDVPGYNASHGCIRVYPSDARWLSNNIIHYGTTVIVRPY